MNPVFTKSGLKIANDYIRIVHGERGNYVEIDSSMIILDTIRIPESENWRITYKKAYYIEYRSIDDCYIKIYFQKRLVKYADYKLGMYYVLFDQVRINKNV